MTRVKEVRKGTWEIDVRGHFPDGTRYRSRKLVRLGSRTAARRWGEEHERSLGDRWRNPPKVMRHVPTLESFGPRFIEDAIAERQKPATVDSKRVALRCHLVPLLGRLTLDEIGAAEIAQLKAELAAKGLGAKATNNTLCALSKLLKTAAAWDVISTAPAIKLLRVPKGTFRFLDFEEWRRLVEAARDAGPEAHLIVLLLGRAGLRTGETRALEWGDVDLVRGQVIVRRSEWRGIVASTKGGRERIVPLTRELQGALSAHRHLRGPRVLYHGGKTLTPKVVELLLGGAARRAGLAGVTPHVLRHSFCSHLAMQGVPCRTIQEYAGHADLGTTLRYMHLTPGHRDSAIRTLEPDAPLALGGEIGERLESRDAK